MALQPVDTPPAQHSFGIKGETKAWHRSAWAARHCCQRDWQQPAGPNCSKNRRGLLSVTIFKQPWLPGDRQHPGSKMLPMQDPAQRQLMGGRGRYPEAQPFPSPSTLLKASTLG